MAKGSSCGSVWMFLGCCPVTGAVKPGSTNATGLVVQPLCSQKAGEQKAFHVVQTTVGSVLQACPERLLSGDTQRKEAFSNSKLSREFFLMLEILVNDL